MTKAEIIDCVYEQVGGFSKKESAEVVEAVFDTMKETLARGDRVKISGFGNFVVREKKQRIGRNPQTGEPIPISARRVLTFKPSQVLKNILNPDKAAEKRRPVMQQWADYCLDLVGVATVETGEVDGADVRAA